MWGFVEAAYAEDAATPVVEAPAVAESPAVAEPPAGAAPLVTFNRAAWAPAPPDGRWIGFGIGYTLGFTSVWAPNTAAFVFRGPNWTVAPRFEATASAAGKPDDHLGGGSLATEIDVTRSAHGTQPWHVLPTVGVGLDTTFDAYNRSRGAGAGGVKYQEIGATVSWGCGIHVERWFGSRFTIEADASNMGIAVAIAHSSQDGTADTVSVRGAFEPRLFAMATIYTERPKRKSAE